MIIETQIGDNIHKLELPDGSTPAQINDAVSHFASNNKDIGQQILDSNAALYKGAGTGVANLGLGLIKAFGNEDPQAIKEAATNVRNYGNENIRQHPIAGTIGEILPQAAVVAPLGASLPALAAGGAGLGYLTPDVNQEEVKPAETALTRLLQPIAAVPQGILKYTGVNPESGGGKALSGGIMGLLMGQTGKDIGKVLGEGVKVPFINKQVPGVNAIAKKAIRGVTKVNPEAVAAYEGVGMQPSLLTTTDNSLIQRGSNVLKNVPFAGGVIEKRLGNDVGQLANVVENKAAGLGSATDKLEGGLALQKGINTSLKRSEGIANKLYNTRDALIPAETPAVTENLINFANAIKQKAGANPLAARSVEKPVLQDVQAILSTKEAPYGSLTAFRSKIGEKAGRMDAPSEFKQMYGAASEDMLQTANKVSPEAAKAAERANNFYRGISQRKDSLSRFVAKDAEGNFKLAPEQATKASRAELAQLKRSIPREDFNNYAASELRQLGRASDGVQNAAENVFSPSTFLTKWVDLGKKRAVLFGENTPLTQELNKAATVAERIKGLNKTANTSNSSNNAVLTGALAGLFYATKKVAGLTGAGYMGAKLLTSPKVLKVINNYAYRPVITNPAVFGDFAARLSQAAGQDPELKQELQKYLENLKQIPDVQMIDTPQFKEAK